MVVRVRVEARAKGLDDDFMAATSQMNKRELATLRRKHPLPDGVPDTELNLTQAAQFMNVSATTLNAWLSQGLPVIQRGGNGKDYKLRGGDIWAWKKAREADEDLRSREAMNAIQAMRLALVGGGLGDSIDALTPKEKREVIATQREHEAFAVDRHELLKREDVRDAFEVVFGLMRDSLDSLPDRIHREASLSNKQMGLASEICDRTLKEIEGRITRFFSDRPKGKASRRTDLLDIN